MPDVQFYMLVDGTTVSQSAITPFKHNTVGSIGGNVSWDLDAPSSVKGLITNLDHLYL